MYIDDVCSEDVSFDINLRQSWLRSSLSLVKRWGSRLERKRRTWPVGIESWNVMQSVIVKQSFRDEPACSQRLGGASLPVLCLQSKDVKGCSGEHVKRRSSNILAQRFAAAATEATPGTTSCITSPIRHMASHRKMWQIGRLVASSDFHDLTTS